jgi:hypothetical protein
MNSIVIVLSLASLVICFWNRNDVPENARLHPGTLEEPRQQSTREPGFTARYEGVDYRIDPQFEYELTGMIVSYRHHDGKSRMHRRSGDHLNMLDVCVVWGDNARHPDINALEFWNGIFTCNVKTRDRDAWAAFDMYQLSNNHLISDDPAIRDAVTDISIGDQIRVRGWLASYTGPVGTRGTSTTRTDTGDGACETIYVNDFAIVQEAASNWVRGMYASLAFFLGGIVVHLRRPYRPYRNDG